MKFSFSWLKTHLDTDASLESICDKLTAIGLEVESVDDPGKKLAPFIIAQIKEAVQHPNADRLRVCKVDTGKEILNVVCGAPNARAGIKVVLARPGDVMPDSGEALKKGKIRDVESEGMMCALDELCLGGDHEGIIELPADAPVGGNFAQFMGHNDPVIDINLTPNRPDCAGILGIARDLAAAGLGKMKMPDTRPVAAKGASPIKVKLDFGSDNKPCPYFVGRMIKGVKNGPSPDWLQRRLLSIGLRPISALVDITNFLTFDCNRPLHVFDAAKVKGDLRVYLAKGGEKLAALNNKDYTLEPGMCVIGDDTDVLSLGGIMGGVPSSCDENTTDIFVEAAYFDPVRTALTGRALQITSDARYRFERGIDPAFTQSGMEIATRLILEICGTDKTEASELEIAGSPVAHGKPITLDSGKCLKHTGVDVSAAEQEKILSALGFVVQNKTGHFIVTAPTWRPDIEGAADLVEEIIRIKGYEYLPATSLHRGSAVTKVAIDIQDTRERAMRRGLAAQGLMECVTWSFMPSAIAAQFGAIDGAMRLANPISSDLDVMRPSVLGNLIQAAKRNADRGFKDAGLFEIGPIFKNQTPEGQIMLATGLRSGQTPRHWAEKQRAVDAFDAKGDVIAALTAAGAPAANLQITPDAPGWYHPGRSGAIRLGPNVLAYFGELHPALLKACDAEGPMAGFEIFIAATPVSRSTGSARPLLKLEALQPVERDFAFLVAQDVTAAKLIKAVKDADKHLIKEVSLFDIYQGDRIEAGKKSVALSVSLQPTAKSLTDAEIDAVSAKIKASVERATGATLRV